MLTSDLFGEALRFDLETNAWLRERIAALGLDQPIDPSQFDPHGPSITTP